MKTRSLNFLLVLMLGIGLGFVACQPAEDREAEDNLNAAREEMEMEKKELREDIRNMQRRIDQRIDELRNEITPETEQARKDRLQARINELQNEKQELDRQLAQIDNTTTDGWEKFKADVREFFNDIERGLEETFDNDDIDDNNNQ